MPRYETGIGTWDQVVRQNQPLRPTIQLRDSGGAALNLTGYTAPKLQVRKVPTAPDAVLTCSPTDSTLTIVSPATAGQLALYLDASSIEPGDYCWDCQIIDSLGEPWVLWAGALIIEGGVTR